MRKKYSGFIWKYIDSKGSKLCLTTKIKEKYSEKFFDDAVKGRILKEIEKNDKGQRQFKFTDYARKFLN